MGQYFKAVNMDKKEVVCPWCINGGAKLLEWTANRYGSIFALLLRKSDEYGGGDIHEPVYELDSNAIPGRWAGDRVVLIGDYDSSELWRRSKPYTNISEPLVEVWNRLFHEPWDQLSFNEHCTCGEIES